MESYTAQSTSELKNKLRKYGYRGFSSLPKDKLVDMSYIADMEHKLVKKYKSNPIDYSKFSNGRCNSYRKQRFIPINDLKVVKLLLFSGLFRDIDFTMEDIKEFLWVSVYIKKDIFYTNVFAQLKCNTYFYVNVVIKDDNINLSLAKDKDYTKIVNNVMTNADYYWYRHTTELQKQLNLIRNTEERFSDNFQDNIDNLGYVMFKIQTDNNIKIVDVDKYDDINHIDNEFDYMNTVNKLFWVHLNLNNFDKNLILYMSKSGVYTLFKFRYEIKMENDIPVGKILMPKVYLSKSYTNLIQKALTHPEYEMYLNETI
jgi:hypothetical protein